MRDADDAVEEEGKGEMAYDEQEELGEAEDEQQREPHQSMTMMMMRRRRKKKKKKWINRMPQVGGQTAHQKEAALARMMTTMTIRNGGSKSGRR